MAEGLSAAEVGKEIGEHRMAGEHEEPSSSRRDRLLSITEAVLLSVVAILAAYSGFAAAKWSTESSVDAREGVRGAHKGQPGGPRSASVADAGLGLLQRVVRCVRGRQPDR